MHGECTESHLQDSSKEIQMYSLQRIHLYKQSSVNISFRDALLDGKIIGDYYYNSGNKYMLVYTIQIGLNVNGICSIND